MQSKDPVSIANVLSYRIGISGRIGWTEEVCRTCGMFMTSNNDSTDYADRIRFNGVEKAIAPKRNIPGLTSCRSRDDGKGEG